MDKICLECNNGFKVPKCRENAKYCSVECRIKSQKTDKNPLRKRKIINCKQCCNDFEVNKYLKSEFCSRNCYWDFRRENPSVKIQSNQGINLVKKECDECGCEYEVNKYREKTSKFCSVECHDNFRRDSLVCPTCEVIFKAAKFQKRKYCSEKCASKGFDKRKSKFSIDVTKFLIDKYDIEDEFFIKTNDAKLFGDILLKDYYLIIECNGDYWHCNPKIYDTNYYHKQIRKFAYEIWDKDLTKIKKLEKLGYSVLTVWEYDWNNNNEFFNDLKNKIENEICKNKRNK